MVTRGLTDIVKYPMQGRTISATGIFLGLVWGQISAPSQFKNEQNLPKMEYIIYNFLVLHFDEHFIKKKKIAKLQMHQNLHKNVNENMFFIYIFMQIYISFMKGN